MFKLRQMKTQQWHYIKDFFCQYVFIPNRISNLFYMGFCAVQHCIFVLKKVLLSCILSLFETEQPQDSFLSQSCWIDLSKEILLQKLQL